MEGPFAEVNGGMFSDAAYSSFDMERWFEDYEWSVCWDFEMNSWSSSKPAGFAGWQPQEQQQPSWAMGMVKGVVGPAPGPPPGPPPGAAPSSWFPEPSAKGSSWGMAPSLDGPYIGDANSGEKQDSWGGGDPGYKSWSQPSQKGGATSGSKQWSGSSGRGRGAKGWTESGEGSRSARAEESWQGSSWWGQDDWSTGGRGRGKGAGKRAEAEEWQAWPSESWGSGATGKGSSASKDGKGASASWEKSQEPKGKGKAAKKSAAGPPVWQPRESRAANANSPPSGGGEANAESARAAEAPKDDVVAEIDALLKEESSNLEKADFDFRVRRFLFALRTSGGRQKVRDALAMIQTYTQQKSRQSVKNWPAYLLTLLKKFEPEPFTKSKGKGKGRDVDQEQDDARQAAKPSSKKTLAPVAASAGAGAAPKGDADEEVEVVRAEESTRAEQPKSGSDAPRQNVTLPPGWEDGRSALFEEISTALLGSSAKSDQLRCPFTSRPLDLEAVLVSQVASSLRASATSSSSQHASHHLAGLARSRGVVDCPRAAAAAALLAGNSELAALPDNASAMDAVVACTAAGEASTATTVMQEVALELTAEVLRNSQLGSDDKW